MKYYSETLKQLFDSEEAVKAAEEEHAIALKNKEELEAQQKAEISKQKKELADKIDQAKLAYDEAYESFETAKKKANDILQEAKKQAGLEVRTAQENLNKAYKDVYDAIGEFNSKFGVYNRTYTGKDAVKEFRRASNQIDDFIRTFFWF